MCSPSKYFNVQKLYMFMYFLKEETPNCISFTLPQTWIHPWLVLTSLAYLYVSGTEILSHGSSPFYPGHLGRFPCFHLRPQEIAGNSCLKTSDQAPSSLTQSQALGFVRCFPATHRFGVSFGYVLYVKCIAILVSTLPPIAYNSCCLITFFSQ